MKWIMVLLGLALSMLGAAGIDRGFTLFGWIDIALAMVAVLAGVTVRNYPRLRLTPMLLGFVVIALALVGMTMSAANAPWWILRWNLFLGVGLVLDGVMGLRPARVTREAYRPSHPSLA
ncbi:MAG: hypothetical protein ACXVEF_42080 [Polyangiales bacterium]